MPQARAQDHDDSEQDIITMDGSAGKRLKSFIERIERLEEEKAGLSADIKDIYGEAKAVGFDPKIMRQVIRLRKMKPEDRAYQQQVLATYANALGLDLL